MPHSANYKFSNSWSDGFQGTVYTKIGENIRGGWTMVLTFSSPLTSLDVHNAEIKTTSADKKVYTVRNAAYNADLWAGQDMNVDIVANFNSGTPRLVAATFQGIAAAGF